MFTLEEWAWIATIAVPVGAFLVWVGRLWESRRRGRAARAAADAALVADVRAQRETDDLGGPVLVLTNRGTVDALQVRVTVDGSPLDKHPIFCGYYLKGSSDTLEPGEPRRFRGLHFDMGQRAFDVRVEWTTAKARAGSWAGLLHRP